MAINQNSALSLLLSRAVVFAAFGECSGNGDGNSSPVVSPILRSRTISCVVHAAYAVPRWCLGRVSESKNRLFGVSAL